MSLFDHLYTSALVGNKEINTPYGMQLAEKRVSMPVEKLSSISSPKLSLKSTEVDFGFHPFGNNKTEY